MMRIDILTLFPEYVDFILSESIIGRARRAGKLDVRAHNIRDWSEDKHRRVDDTPYGGGRGMLMAAPPIWRAWKAVTEEDFENPAAVKRKTVYLSPGGRYSIRKRPRSSPGTISSFSSAAITRAWTSGSSKRWWTRRSPWGISS